MRNGEKSDARLVCENRNAFHLAVARNAGEPWGDGPDCFFAAARGDGPIRLVSRVRLDQGNPDASFARLVERIRSGELPPNVAVDLLCDPENIGERFGEMGAQGRNQILMALDLKDLAGAGMTPHDSVVEIAEIHSVRDCVELPTRWLWSGDESMIERNARLFAPSFGDSRFFFFIVRSRGKAVSSALLFADPQEGAGVYAVATPPGERGKGFGGLVTRACVEEAKRRGFDKIVLYATALGEPVYARMGFRVVGRAVSWRVK